MSKMKRIKELITLFREGDKETKMYILYTFGWVIADILIIVGTIIFIYIVYIFYNK
ncbi:MAG: hypothetical protein KAV80_01325 [Methanomicrobia archaeon]|nr:hypothetical protein [Methanomicrobia archaeon]